MYKSFAWGVWYGVFCVGVVWGFGWEDVLVMIEWTRMLDVRCVVLRGGEAKEKVKG